MTRTNFWGEEILTFEIEIPVRVYHPKAGIPGNKERTQWESSISISIDAVNANDAIKILQNRLGKPMSDM